MKSSVPAGHLNGPSSCNWSQGIYQGPIWLAATRFCKNGLVILELLNSSLTKALFPQGIVLFPWRYPQGKSYPIFAASKIPTMAGHSFHETCGLEQEGNWWQGGSILGRKNGITSSLRKKTGKAMNLYYIWCPAWSDLNDRDRKSVYFTYLGDEFIHWDCELPVPWFHPDHQDDIFEIGDPK